MVKRIKLASPDTFFMALSDIVGISQRKAEENVAKLKKLGLVERRRSDLYL